VPPSQWPGWSVWRGGGGERPELLHDLLFRVSDVPLSPGAWVSTAPGNRNGSTSGPAVSDGGQGSRHDSSGSPVSSGRQLSQRLTVLPVHRRLAAPRPPQFPDLRCGSSRMGPLSARPVYDHARRRVCPESECEGLADTQVIMLQCGPCPPVTSCRVIAASRDWEVQSMLRAWNNVSCLARIHHNRH